MYLYEIGETVEKGLLLQREPYPHIESPPHSDTRFILAKNISEGAERIPKVLPGLLRLDYADLETSRDAILLKRDGIGGRSRKKFPALIRVGIAGGCGGVARLLANCFTDVVVQKNFDEVGRKYESFPSAGVHPFCTQEHVDRLKLGVEFLDVLLLLQPGAGFRIHRTGDLKDQHGVKAGSQIAVRWVGHDLWRGRTTIPGLLVKHYDDRVPVLNPLEEVPAVAAE